MWKQKNNLELQNLYRKINNAVYKSAKNTVVRACRKNGGRQNGKESVVLENSGKEKTSSIKDMVVECNVKKKPG